MTLNDHFLGGFAQKIVNPVAFVLDPNHADNTHSALLPELPRGEEYVEERQALKIDGLFDNKNALLILNESHSSILTTREDRGFSLKSTIS